MRQIIIFTLMLLISACGGGGGNGSFVNAVLPNQTLNGIAATGAAIANGAVSLKCIGGGSSSSTTSTGGSFSFTLSGAQSLPCILRVNSGLTTLYGYASSSGRVNITPLTDLVLAYAGNDLPANLFNNFNSAIASSINTNLVSAKTYLTQQINTLDYNPITIDPLSGVFSIGDNHDQILDQLKTSLTLNGKGQDDLRVLAKNRSNLNTQLPSGQLQITEIASGYYADMPFWFEIVNLGNAAVNLSNYKVKISQAVLNISPYTLSGRQSFDLPNVNLAAGAFMVVRGQSSISPQTNTTQIIYISDSSNPNKVPYWTESGSIEILKNGITRNFVRFGSNTDTPATGSVSTTAPALPNAVNGYGNSIVLPGSSAALINPNGAWSSVAWTTPAGPNDVSASAVDADNDGIPDSAEISGGTFSGLDLYAMGARTNQRDILIEVDYMNTADPGVTPQKQALDNVKAAFAAKNVNMIIDAGNLFGDSLNAGYNWGGGQSVPTATCVYLGPKSGCSGDIYLYKNQYFDIRRASIFHYALFATSQNLDGSSGSSGVAELPGNDFLITLGGWGLNTSNVANTNKLINYQAGTFMHELGHNLNLRHGGFENVNYKPNYFSVMNYIYQLDGLSSSATGVGPFQRWKCVVKGICGLTESASTSNSIVIDYSNGTSADLVETALFENANIGRGADGGVYADWNLSGVLDASSYALNLNPAYDITLGALQDYNDWVNIVWPFTRLYAGSYGSSLDIPSAPAKLLDPMSNDRQPFIVETLYAPHH